MPCVGADSVRDEGCEQPIEVEQEEDGQDTADEEFNEKDPGMR